MISLKNVASGYNNKPVIKKVNITFKKGTITSIIGRNGCGKTTLLKTSSNLIKPLSGEVLLNGTNGIQNLCNMKSNQISKIISFLPQNKTIPNITVYNLVMHGRFPYLNFARIPQREDKIIVKNIIDMMDINEHKNKSLFELSGGERQKVYIAMVLAQNTDIIFLDEPTTYLDINHQLEIIEIIRGLKEMGKTIVMVLHDINNALTYSDNICLMDKGEIIIYDTPNAVIQSNMIDRVFNVCCEEICINDSTHYVITLPES